MLDFEDLCSRMNTKTLDLARSCENEFEQSLLWIANLGKEIDAKLLAFSNSGKVDVTLLPKPPIVDKKRKAAHSDDSDNVSVKKLCNSILEEENTSCSSYGKPKRNASKLAQQRINQAANIKLNTKMRRPSNTENLGNDSKMNVFVKLEKLSTGPKVPERNILESVSAKSVLVDVTNENMPPPAANPKRLRKKVKKELEESDSDNENIRTTRTRSRRQQKNDSKQADSAVINKAKDSDVFIQEISIPIVILTDSEVESHEEVEKNIDDTNNSQESVASTKAKKAKTAKGKKKKQAADNKIKIKEEPDVQNSKDNVVQNESLYEDALSDKPVERSSVNIHKTTELITNTTFTVCAQLNLNSTHVISKVTPEKTVEQVQKLSTELQEAVRKTGVQVNCTVVLENANIESNLNATKVLSLREVTSPWKKAEVALEQPMLTSDEEEKESDDNHSVEVTPPKPKQKAEVTQTKSKKGNAKPTPMFSPYSNSPVKNRVAAFEKLKDTVDMPTRVTRTKTKLLAEKDAKKDPLPVSTTSSRVPVKSASKYLTPLSGNKIPSMIPNTDGKYKTNSTTFKNHDIPVKSVSAIKPTRNELQERREEEQKRKMEREEEVKRKKDAMLQAKIEEQRKKREEKQLNAQKAREAQDREKEEKLRRMLHEKEKKQQQEEQMKKEWLVQKELLKKREKEKEEKLRIKILEQENFKKKLNQKLPPLPTGDLEDSGDETPKMKYIGPLWSQSQNLRKALHTWGKVPSCYYEFLFNMRPQTPDLCEIFDHVDERIMRRTSSAFWRTPPRFSILPRF